MSFKGFSIFSPGHHFVQQSGAILVILAEGHWWNTSVQIFWNQAIGQGRKSLMSFEDFVFFNSCSMEQNHCGHLGFLINKILACFDSSRHLSFKTRVQLLCTHRNAPCQRDLAIDKAEPPASAVKWQGNDQTDLQCQAARHCHHQVQWATCAAWHWGSEPHSEGEKTPIGWTCGTLQWCS